MTSRERVIRAFDFKESDKIPEWCGSSPEFMSGLILINFWVRQYVSVKQVILI